jgi:tRNA (guanine6-N2)-methyltransferase
MNNKTELTCYGQTMPGVEEISWLEIRDRLPHVVFRETLFAKDQNGIVIFDYSGPLEKLLDLRTTEDVFLQAINEKRVSRGRQDLKEFTILVHKSEPFGQAANTLLRYRKFSRPPTYRVISRKYGKHQYRRKDLETAVLMGIQARYPRWTPVADNAQVEIWANLLGSHLLIGLRLSDRTMRHRHKKRVELPASLRPSVAAAMVYLTQPEANDVFMDPMCGSGTIILERLFGGPSKEILGGDIDPDSVNAARQNMPQPKKGRQQRKLTIRQWDARQLPLDEGYVDKVATNLPFGKQVGKAQNLEGLYNNIFAELQRVVKPGGRIVLLSSEYELVKTCIRAHSKLQIVTGYSIATLGQWGRIHVVDRLP